MLNLRYVKCFLHLGIACLCLTFLCALEPSAWATPGKVSKPANLQDRFNQHLQKMNGSELINDIKSGIPVNTRMRVKCSLSADLCRRLSMESSPTALMMMVKKGDYATVKALLDLGANPNLPGFQKRNALGMALSFEPPDRIPNISNRLKQQALLPERIKIILLLIQKGANIHGFSDTHCETIFQAAVRHGDKQVMETLLAKGASINERTPDVDGELNCQTQSDSIYPVPLLPLASAAVEGNVETIQFLLDRGAQLNGTDKAGRTALMEAVRSARMNWVNQTYAEDAVRTYQQPLRPELAKYQPTLKMIQQAQDKLAREQRRYEQSKKAIQYLLKQGADLALKDKNGDQAFHYTRGHSELMMLVDEQRCRFLSAASRADYETVKNMVETGTDINVTGMNNRTALSYALNVKSNISKTEHVKTAKYLIENGADIHVPGENACQTLLNAAIDTDDIAFIQLLVSKGLDVNQAYNHNKAPGFDEDCHRHFLPSLIKAISSNNIRLTEFLLSNGADPNAAAGFDNEPILFQLVWESNNAPNDTKRLDWIEFIRLLLKYGANANYKHKTGYSLLDIAKMNQADPEIYELLKQYQ